MRSTDQKPEIAPYVSTYFWVTIKYKYHANHIDGDMNLNPDMDYPGFFFIIRIQIQEDFLIIQGIW